MVLREFLARFGIDFDTEAVNKGAAGVEGLVSNIRRLAKVAAGSAVVVGIWKFVDSVSTMGEELRRTASQLGMGVEELNEWRNAAALAGVSSSDLTSAMESVRGAMKSAMLGGEDASRVFARLGVSIMAPGGGLRDLNEVFEEAAGRIHTIENAQERAMISSALFGGAASKMGLFFEEGAEGIEALRAAARGMPGDVEAFAQAATDARGALARLSMVMERARMILATAVLPIFARVTTAVADGLAWLQRLADGTNAYQAALIVMIPVVGYFARAMIQAGLRIMIAWAPVIAKAALIAAAIAAIVLIVDDLIALFTGGESVIGRFIDSIFGVGASATAVEAVKDAFAAVVDWAGRAWETTKEWAASFAEAFGAVVDFLADTFGPAIEQAKEYFQALLDLGKQVAIFLRDTLAAVWGFVFDEVRDKLGKLGNLVKRVGEFFGISFTWGDVKDAAESAVKLAASGVEAAFSGGTKVIQTAANTVRQVNQQTQANITVNGATDPEETARLVAQELRKHQEAEIEAAHADLVPVGG